jgi:hypothetical protein
MFHGLGEDGWIVRLVPEPPRGARQGRTRDEARAHVIDALDGSSRLGEHSCAAIPVDGEPLELFIDARRPGTSAAA